MAAKITLEIKRTACKLCSNADQRALRKHWPHCQAKNPRNRNGHCTAFSTMKPKSQRQREEGAAHE